MLYSHRVYRENGRVFVIRLGLSCGWHVVLQSCNESVVKKAALLADMHLRSLRQKMTLLQLTEESAKKLEVIQRGCYQTTGVCK